MDVNDTPIELVLTVLVQKLILLGLHNVTLDIISNVNDPTTLDLNARSVLTFEDGSSVTMSYPDFFWIARHPGGTEDANENGPYQYFFIEDAMRQLGLIPFPELPSPS